VIGGDGIGPDVVEQAILVLETAAGSGVYAFDRLPYGAEYTLRTGVTIPPGELARFATDYDAIFLGALGDPRIPDMRHGRDILLGARMQLDLYINLRPVRLLHDDLTPLKGRRRGDIDFVIYRENTEDLYAGIGGHLRPGTPDEVALSEMIATYRGTERIMRAGFEHCRTHQKPRLCLAIKHNAIPHAHGLWRRVFEELRAEYTDVEASLLHADVTAMEMVRNPQRFDVLVTSNFLGDVLSDLGAAIVGGLGLAPSANLHPGRTSLFEPVHGSAPDLAGLDRANPFAAILTGAMLARWLGQTEVADRIERAVVACLDNRRTTPDLGGTLGTCAAGEAVCKALA
jgi:3-isopropylmalate dehydrogenase